MERFETIGRYKIIEELGRGAMGTVFKAQDTLLGRMVAVKGIQLDTLADDSERNKMRDRLFREAQSAGILSHPGIVTIYDFVEEHGTVFIFMELVNGPSLDKILKAKQPPSKPALLSIFRQTAAALDFAHKKGIVHRDIKPGNIMVDENNVAKITDFGIAKVASEQMTRAEIVMGTPSYMSPEQAFGGAVSGRSDQFSLAVLAYTVLTGEKPFTANTLPALLFKIVRDHPVAPHKLNTTLLPVVDSIMSKALAKDPEERYETCTVFIDTLAAACAASPDWVPMARKVTDPPSHQSPALRQPAAAPAAETFPGTDAGTHDGAVVESAVPIHNVIRHRQPPPASASPALEPTEPRPAELAPPEFSHNVEPAARDWRLRGSQPGGNWLRNGLIAAAAAAVVVAGGAYFISFRDSGSSPNSSPPAAVATPARAVSSTSGKPEEENAGAATNAPVASTEPSGPPSPTEATFVLTTTPEGAEATFDNDPGVRCVTPCYINLALARHTIMIHRNGYRDVQRVFTVPKDKELAVEMEAMAGTLSLVTNPPGLSIIVDGKEQTRKTPARLTLSAGPHQIQVVKGAEKQEFTVDIRDGVATGRSIDWGQ